jgi:hypothetical protein
MKASLIFDTLLVYQIDLKHSSMLIKYLEKKKNYFKSKRLDPSFHGSINYSLVRFGQPSRMIYLPPILEKTLPVI